MSNTGLVFDIHRCTLDDGPGIRNTVFLKGCFLKCKWCHNPESQSFYPELLVRKDKCIDCGMCSKVCPNGVFSNMSAKHFVNRNLCNACGKCSKFCPTSALHIAGKEMTVKQIIQTVLKDKKHYNATGGGLTLSGGEPLAQPQFSKNILHSAKQNKIHTCVETSGIGCVDSIKLLMPYVDLWYYDIKSSPSHYETYTKTSITPVLSGLSMLLKNKCQVVLRCPIVPGIHDNINYTFFINELVEEYSQIYPIEDVHFLPYHTYGKDKYLSLDRLPVEF